MKILVVDDDPQLRAVLRHILRRDGHAVCEAEDGDVALQALGKDETIALALIDMVMPRKEGLETILDIRRAEAPGTARAERPVKIIAMSGGPRFHMHDPLHLALSCGADFVIEKPFEPAALRALVQQAENFVQQAENKG